MTHAQLILMSSSQLKNLLRCHPNFPTPGINFYDVLPLVEDKSAFNLTIKLLVQIINKNGWKFDYVAEARGFLFGPTIASIIGCGFIPIRKKGKLPGNIMTSVYKKEYGDDYLEIQNIDDRRGKKVIIFDDLLATGGSVNCAIDLLKKVHFDVLGCIFVVDLTYLHDRNVFPNLPFESLIKIDSEIELD